LAETIPLAALGKTFGVPPHRYHASRRIEHAKTIGESFLSRSAPQASRGRRRRARNRYRRP
jgi:hypothetical protein